MASAMVLALVAGTLAGLRESSHGGAVFLTAGVGRVGVPRSVASVWCVTWQLRRCLAGSYHESFVRFR
jgi:hypothetical protein